MAKNVSPYGSPMNLNCTVKSAPGVTTPKHWTIVIVDTSSGQPKPSAPSSGATVHIPNDPNVTYHVTLRVDGKTYDFDIKGDGVLVYSTP